MYGINFFYRTKEWCRCPWCLCDDFYIRKQRISATTCQCQYTAGSDSETTARVHIQNEMYVISHGNNHSYDNYYLVKNSFLAYFESKTILAVIDHMTFPWPLLNSRRTLPHKWLPWVQHDDDVWINQPIIWLWCSHLHGAVQPLSEVSVLVLNSLHCTVTFTTRNTVQLKVHSLTTYWSWSACPDVAVASSNKWSTCLV